MFLGTHSVYESRFEDERDHATAMEAHRYAAYQRIHGSSDGYMPGREFPCPGILHAVDKSGPMWMVECDACGFQTSIRSPSRLDDGPSVSPSARRADW